MLYIMEPNLNQLTDFKDPDVMVARFKEKIREQTANSDVKLSPMSSRELRRERNKAKNHANAAITYEKVKRHKQRWINNALAIIALSSIRLFRKERRYRKSLQNKPRAISAAKERRGVKVLGIILGAYCCCWTPFFM